MIIILSTTFTLQVLLPLSLTTIIKWQLQLHVRERQFIWFNSRWLSNVTTCRAETNNNSTRDSTSTFNNLHRWTFSLLHLCDNYVNFCNFCFAALSRSLDTQNHSLRSLWMVWCQLVMQLLPIMQLLPHVCNLTRIFQPLSRSEGTNH